MKQQINSSTVDRKVHPVRVLQFGDGNFLRGFVDWMIEKANVAGVTDLGVTIVQPRSKKLSDVMRQQDCLFHVYLEGMKDRKLIKDITLVTCVNEIINPYLEYRQYEKLFLSPQLELIISNTTEAGIRYDSDDDIFSLPPESFPAKMTALLYKRFLKYGGAKDKGLLVICTELIENNGSKLKEYIVQHSLRNELFEFIEWLNEVCFFYDTLVDRIVSGFPKQDAEEIKNELGYDDNLIVKGEYFHVWAIGGNPIIKEKFALDKAGLHVLFMEDISTFRDRKVRVLNGAHTAMVPIAIQLGHQAVVEAFADPLVERFILSMITHEVLPMIDGDKEELKDFADAILERFHNPCIQHYLKDISLNSLSKWEARNLPTLLDNSMSNSLAQRTAFSFAAMLVLYSGKLNLDFQPNDTASSVQYIQSTFDEENIVGWVENVVKNKDIWNADFSAIEGFVPFVGQAVKTILEQGMQEALKVFFNLKKVE